MILRSIQKAMGSKTTTTAQLNSAGRSLLGGGYKGAWPADLIPKLKNKEVAIANLDDSKGPGTHWIALAKDKGKIIVYDSFGRKSSKIMPNLHRAKRGKRKGGKMVIDTELDGEQGKRQSNCGQRCLAALLVYQIYGSSGLLKL